MYACIQWGDGGVRLLHYFPWKKCGGYVVFQNKRISGKQLADHRRKRTDSVCKWKGKRTGKTDAGNSGFGKQWGKDRKSDDSLLWRENRVWDWTEDGTSQESDLCLDPFHRTAFCSDFSDRDRNHSDCRICGIHENDTSAEVYRRRYPEIWKRQTGCADAGIWYKRVWWDQHTV